MSRTLKQNLLQGKTEKKYIFSLCSNYFCFWGFQLTMQTHTENFKHKILKIKNEITHCTIGRTIEAKKSSTCSNSQSSQHFQSLKDNIEEIKTPVISGKDTTTSAPMKTNEKVLKWLESVVNLKPDEMDSAELLKTARESLDDEERPLQLSTQKEYLTGPFRTISITPSISVYHQLRNRRKNPSNSRRHLFRKS